MRQLLAASDGNVVLALNHVALAFLSSSAVLQNFEGDSSSNSSTYFAVELLPPCTQSSTPSSNGGLNDKEDENEDETVDEKPKDNASEDVADTGNKKDAETTNKTNNDAKTKKRPGDDGKGGRLPGLGKFTVQAVSCFVDVEVELNATVGDNQVVRGGDKETKNTDDKTFIVYCAVSWTDKTIGIYKLRVKDFLKLKQQKSIIAVQPDLMYHVPKRCCALTFTKCQNQIVLLAGDLFGDVTAYSTSSSSALTSQLLLGHTASTITSVKVITLPKDGSQRILTSDKDEKVRISKFPATFVIDGFLLNHTAFISSMDIGLDTSVGSGGQHKCVTCSGDGCVRLWHCPSFRELDSIYYEESNITNFPSPLLIADSKNSNMDETKKTEDGNASTNHDKKEDAEASKEDSTGNDNDEGNANDNGEQHGEHHPHTSLSSPSYKFIHTNVAMESSSNLVVLLRNECHMMEILDTSNGRIEKQQPVQCDEKNESTLPLYATFTLPRRLSCSTSTTVDNNDEETLLVATTSLPFLRQYKIMPSKDTRRLEDVTNISPLCKVVSNTINLLPKNKSTEDEMIAEARAVSADSAKEQRDPLSVSSTILEMDEWGNLMLNKSKENPNHHVHEHKKNWNTFEKKKRDQEKQKRIKRRKKIEDN